jgi:enolase
MANPTIRRVYARQVLDSRGNPTVEVEVTLADGTMGRAGVPSGASTGSHEAVELRDGGEAWGGKGVTHAVANVNGEINDALSGRDASDHATVDRVLIELDGTPNKGRLGANAILGTSLALARALAAASGQQLWEWLGGAYEGAAAPAMPVPMLNIINGGEHANNGLDVQEFMVVPHGFPTYSEALRAGVQVFHTLKQRLDSLGHSTAVGDEGGFAPGLASNHEALELLVDAIERAGYEPGGQVAIALDVAATEFYRDGAYHFAGDGVTLDAAEVVDRYEQWVRQAPIVSIEDGMSEDDFAGWKQLTDQLGGEIQLVGDDLFVTNTQRLRTGIDQGMANALLVKVNQIGTLSETIEAMNIAAAAGYRNVMSHRSGETEDPIIADLAVGTACGQIKTGAPSRSERVAKYNQLLRIEEALGDRATFRSPYATAAPAS